MTALNTLSTPRATVGDRANPGTRPEELIAAADRFGQMQLSDQRWVYEERQLDGLLRDAVTLSTNPRRTVWQTIIEDSDTPLVVKLRTFAAAVESVGATSDLPTR